MSTSDTDLSHNQVRVGDERLGVIHSGGRYTLGFGRDYYGIWEHGAPDGPAQRFPASEGGRNSAWQRYLELEPAAQQARAAELPAEEGEEEARRGWTRRRIIAASTAAVVLILIFALIQFNKEGPTGGSGGGGAVGRAAHIDITGGATVTEDLTQQAFRFTGFGTLYPKVEATWKGPTVTMHLSMNVPNLGTNTTNQNPFRVFDVTLAVEPSASATESGSPAASPSGSPASGGTKFLSLQGECQIVLNTMEKDGIAGTFDCTGIPALTSSSLTIDAKGTLGAGS
jgi:hypothetical protein